MCVVLPSKRTLEIVLLVSLSHSMMNPQIDKVVKVTTVVATAVVSYFLLTADYGPEPNALDPIRERIFSAQDSVKEFIFPSKKRPDK